jgi:elongation factor Ts
MPQYIASYVHGEGKVGVLVQLSCNDSFSVRTEEFKNLAHDLTLQIAASKPLSVSSSDLAPEHWERELSILNERLAGFDTAERQRRLKQMREQFEREWCLLKQPYIKDQTVSVEALLSQVGQKLRDRISVVRFVRYEATET